jgi:anti-sigma B factor antagonist
MNTPKLSILREESSPGAPVVMHLTGPLVMATIADFQRTLRGETTAAVVLDFTEVPFIDSSGLGSMIGIHLHYKQANRKLAVTNMNEKCTALLKMTNVENLFPTFVSIDAARAALA